MRDTLTFTFSGGYYDAGNNVEVPEGAFIAPSTNIIYDKIGRLISFGGLSLFSNTIGGKNVQVIDDGIIALFTESSGNIVRGEDNSAWFVGTSGNVHIYDISGNTPVLKVSFAVSSEPKTAKYSATTDTWTAAFAVGMAEVDTAPALAAVPAPTGFTGLVFGSRSVRIAAKRYDAVSVASPSSAVVEAAETGSALTVTLPTAGIFSAGNDAEIKKNCFWVIYVTYKGQGSTSTHREFPILIPLTEFDEENPTVHTYGNAKYKVTDKTNRKVTIEFNDNELLFSTPNDDTYNLDTCKFLAKLGNVMCGIGVESEDTATGFDVSYPNEYESFPPEWRDWFAEVPVGIASDEDMGFFWVCSANNTYLAKWTGVTEGSAPVVLEKISNVYGTIGPNAMLSHMGVLYTVSSGKTPVAISPDGQINDKFGAPVSEYFKNFTDKAYIIWDENTSTLIFADKRTAIGFHTQTNTWTSPIELSNTADSFCGFSLDGNAFLCFGSSIRKWNSVQYSNNIPTGEPSWKLVSAFQFGSNGRALKDIIQVEAVVTDRICQIYGQNTAVTSTLSFGSYKNFNTSGNVINLASYTITNKGSLISIRKFAESLDYDCISAVIEGTLPQQTIHSVMYVTDVHNIERLT